MAAPYLLCLISLLAALAIINQTEAEPTEVEFVIYNHARQTSGGQIFESRLRNGAVGAMRVAMKHIWHILGQSDCPEGERVKLKKIVLAIEQIEEASIFELKNQIGRISINADKLADIDTASLGSYFFDLIYYEMGRILQWNGKGETPPKIRNGIAAYLVLSTGSGHPMGWAKFGDGNSWDESPGVTGRFFQYVTDDLRCLDFVRKLNEKMKDSYKENYFFELTKKTISEAWKEYRTKYNKPV